jgi:hypothetical protein
VRTYQRIKIPLSLVAGGVSGSRSTESFSV